jgi:uncharacterized OsmC-like protein
MPTIRSKYLGDLRTEAIHLASAQKFITDAPLDNQGKGEAFSPTDTVCAALGACMFTIMGIASRTHGQPHQHGRERCREQASCGPIRATLG